MHGILINPSPLLSGDVSECCGGEPSCSAAGALYLLLPPPLPVVRPPGPSVSLLMKGEQPPGVSDGTRGVSVLISIDINLINLNLTTGHSSPDPHLRNEAK